MEIKYTLYALPPSRRCLGSYEYARVTPSYILVYDKGKVDGGVKIDDNELERLSKADEAWLLECNIEIIGKETARHSSEIIEDVSSKIVLLEEALKKEQKRINKEV